MGGTTWFVRAGENSIFLDDFIDKGEVAIGFLSEIGKSALELPKKELTARTKAAFPNWKDGKLSSVVNQFSRFVAEPKKGDAVVTYDPSQRRYILGRLEGETVYSPESPEQPFRRRVIWTSYAPRDDLGAGTRNSLGAIQTFFRVSDDAAKELEAVALPLGSAPPSQRETSPKPRTDVGTVEQLESVPEKSQQFIEDRLGRLDWEEMQQIVAGILRAMNYKPRISPKGGDRGVDIFASPDGLGLEEPRIFVEVKHRPQTPMTAPDIRAFLGGRKQGDRCLYVSTGGFSKDARYEADRSTTPVMLIDLPELRRLFLEYYERLDEDCRSLVPLTKLYWPVDFS